MDTETILWFILPVLAGLYCIWSATFTYYLKKNKSNFWLAIVTYLLIGFSFAMLWTMYFNDAWPTFIPHLIIGIMTVVEVIKVVKQRKTTPQRVTGANSI